ncbi:NAD(P)-dependent oxidoreductase [Nocardia pseudobrasiliensis]|uniref:3-hydroxyisobutyrate dehydrogenase-like beta-hydroxyacid dehydrogenase n=1 Tax=Nocardia pseudobrasiliensis TaxID=45979 RepID=A0A370HY27_9NOCA|nr:NAD(P)-binding domain-containing protein [Nocardia pseudobrasiliensis]RDI63412.1 3-hydroxyisobutyrate dehydrogenase-like beta-hydroxyacid dehydrogenase [Nocardia pseudobrasiliensis]
MQSTSTPVTLLGLGAMGRALAAALISGGHRVTVWNRTPGRDDELVAAGAVSAPAPADAIAGPGPIVAVLLGHASVHETLDPVADKLRGRQLINLTSTAPDEARELAEWAAAHGIDYLDGGIMAVPAMIGQPGSSVLYSGSRSVIDEHRDMLELFGVADYFGEDPGLASLYDFALLSAMYVMFTGFAHGAAMVASAGVSARSFAARATPWIQAMATGLPGHAAFIDSGDYTAETQSLDFNKSALDAITRASHDAGVPTTIIGQVKALIDGQVADGHGPESFARIFEGLRAR